MNEFKKALVQFMSMADDDALSAMQRDKTLAERDTSKTILAALVACGKCLVYGLDIVSRLVNYPSTVARAIERGCRDLVEHELKLNQLLERWRADITDEYDYAEDLACSLVEQLMANWYVEKAMSRMIAAYRDGSMFCFSEPDRLHVVSQLTTSRDNFKRHADAYAEAVKHNKGGEGLRALAFVAQNTGLIRNYRAFLLAHNSEAAVPWFLDQEDFERRPVTDEYVPG